MSLGAILGGADCFWCCRTSTHSWDFCLVTASWLLAWSPTPNSKTGWPEMARRDFKHQNKDRGYV